MNFLLATCLRAEEEEAAEQGKISEFDFEIIENETFICTIIPLDDFFLERDNIDIENNKANE